MKYSRIEDYIIDKINSKELLVGEMIEPNAKLAKTFQVSELTVNKALNSLAQKGYLKRIRGKGTFVSSITGNNQSSTMMHSSLTQEIIRRGKTPSSKLIEYKVVNAKDYPKVKEELKLNDDDLLHYFIRVRKADNLPISLSYSFMPVKLVPYIDINVLDQGSLWSFLEKQNFEGTRICYYTEKVIRADNQKADLLEVEENYPLLYSHHFSVMNNSQPFNYVDSFFVTDRFEVKHVVHMHI